MDLYVSSALLGVAGLGVMALGGVGLRGHHGSHAGHGHGAHAGHSAHFGHAHSHAGHHANGAQSAAHTSAAAHGGHHTGATGVSARDTLGNVAWTIASPRFLFSVALGLGVVGILAGRAFSGAPRFGIALLGGLLFDRLLVTPLWNLTMRFASAPATTLENAITDDATAVTAFDANGQGIVSIDVDGQVVQLLATLRKDDRVLGGARVRAGQRLRVEEVDAEKNRCIVSLV